MKLTSLPTLNQLLLGTYEAWNIWTLPNLLTILLSSQNPLFPLGEIKIFLCKTLSCSSWTPIFLKIISIWWSHFSRRALFFCDNLLRIFNQELPRISIIRFILMSFQLASTNTFSGILYPIVGWMEAKHQRISLRELIMVFLEKHHTKIDDLLIINL